MVAIVDDDDLMRTTLQRLLKSAGLRAQAFPSAAELLRSGHQHDTACLITDIRMPGNVRPGIAGAVECRPLQDSD
jgi:FixJ family two-component response regulator